MFEDFIGPIKLKRKVGFSDTVFTRVSKSKKGIFMLPTNPTFISFGFDSLRSVVMVAWAFLVTPWLIKCFGLSDSIVFKILLEKDVEKNIIQKSTKYSDNRTIISKLKKLVDEAPKEPGVFYLQNESGKVIFLGKGKNIQRELNKVFLKTTDRAKKIQEKVSSFSHELTGNELLTRIKYHTELELLNPKYNIAKKKRTSPIDPFNHEDFLIIDKGRNVEEHAVLLVENNQVMGYGFTNLAFQENQLDILKGILTPIENKLLAKRITKNYLKTNSVQKIVRL